MDDEELIIKPYQFIEAGPFRQMVTDTAQNTKSEAQKEVLRKLVVQGMQWKQRLFEEQGMTLEKLAAELNMDPRYVVRTINTSFLAPDIIERILKGDVPPTLTRAKLYETLPEKWDKQRAELLC